MAEVGTLLSTVAGVTMLRFGVAPTTAVCAFRATLG